MTYVPKLDKALSTFRPFWRALSKKTLPAAFYKALSVGQPHFDTALKF